MYRICVLLNISQKDFEAAQKFRAASSSAKSNPGTGARTKR